jgi:hypothetical protein
MASLEWSLVLVLGAFLGTSLGHQIQVQKKQAARTCRKKSTKEHWVSNKAKQSGEGRSCKERSIACVFGSRFSCVVSFSSLVSVARDSKQLLGSALIFREPSLRRGQGQVALTAVMEAIRACRGR